MKISLLAVGLTLGWTLNAAAGPYSVEEITLPKGTAPEIGGLAFNSKGELVVVTRRSGILVGQPNRDPAAFRWSTFTDVRLHEALGVLVENDRQLLVAQFPELTRITDSNGDGSADRFTTLCDAWGLSGNYHESVAGPLPDGQGNWFLALGTASYNGNTSNRVRGTFSTIGRRGRNFSAVDWRGWVVKVTPEGKIIPWASGFRANNGICLGPDGGLWVTDNQGDFRPTSPLYFVEQGKFYGHPSSLVWDKEFMGNDPQRDPLKEALPALETRRTEAAVLFPHGTMINSPAQPIFDLTGGKFGPFAGQMFVPDASGQRILRVMLDKVAGTWQGACTVWFSSPSLRSGNNRLCFSPDGSTLYVGQTMRGWGGPSEGLQRIIYSGQSPFALLSMTLLADGFELKFTQPLDPAKAADPKNYSLEHYYYPYSQKYGANKTGTTPVPVQAAHVSPDGLSVRLTLGAMQTGRIYQLDTKNLRSASNEAIEHPIVCYTLNRKISD